ncbi:p115 like vesicle tethering protein [Russula earlei]|uniref:P115 like vesicle tethering protein n=1 Tax=Russula earlei TaxID=71964 RepID=A0ACC0U2Q1_9AGAM|nr:p115 like vesicle tethering protein [Russula earlei]
MEFFQQTYTALRGPTGVQQTPADTITRLSDRLSPSTLLADRRAAVLSLKGLARVHKQLVGTHAHRAFSGSSRTTRTSTQISAARPSRPSPPYATRSMALTRNVISAWTILIGCWRMRRRPHKLFALLGDQDPSLRYSACILLIGILQNRPLKVQAYFLKAPVGPATKEIVGHAIAMLAALIRQSVEIQKILAFDGIFEKLLSVVTREGGLEGQSVVTDALKCVDTLLRFNTSNQSYFRETNLPSLLCSLLFFNPNVQPDQADKIANVGLILESIGLLLGSKGSGLREGYAFTKLLIEMGLASNAPTPLKVKCLHTNGEEWDRLEAATGIDALLELIMHGEYNGQDSHFLRDDLVKEAIVSGMLPSENSGTSAHSPVTPLLFGLIIPPSSPFDPILFAHLLRHAPRCKDLARKIVPPPLTPLSTSTAGGAFFVPADGDPPPPPESTSRDDTEDGPQSLLALITEHLSLAFLQRSRAGLAPREAREADRVICVYLLLLSQWLWEDPRALNQPSEIDVVVPGLCAFLLGVCYEFNREPGEITRVTMRGVLVGRMNRMREDERIKVVGPDSWVLPCPTPGPQALDPAFTPMYEGEMEIWFDWAFVDFWKANIHTIQRGIVADPDSASSSTAQSGEESILRSRALQIKLKELTTTPLAFAGASTSETSQTTAEIDEERVALKVALEAERTKRAEVEKEQEDLLVLLDELSSKRAKDKQRMEEQGMDVSEDEEGEGEDEDKEEEE